MDPCIEKKRDMKEQKPKNRIRECQSTYFIQAKPFQQWRKLPCPDKLSLLGDDWRTLDLETLKRGMLEQLPPGHKLNRPCRNRALSLLLDCAKPESKEPPVAIRKGIRKGFKRNRGRLSPQDIEREWSIIQDAPSDVKMLFLTSCLPLVDIVAVAQTNKSLLEFVKIHFSKIAQMLYPLEDRKQAKCALAYSGGDFCPTTEAEWIRKGTLLGQNLQDCQTWCMDHRFFWETVLHWIYDNIKVVALRYKGQEYGSQDYSEQTPVEKLMPAAATNPEVEFHLERTSARTSPLHHNPRDSLSIYEGLSRMAARESKWEYLHVFPPHIEKITLEYKQSYIQRHMQGTTILPYTSSWSLTTSCFDPITLGQVAEAAFRIKRFPFDTFGERFESILKSYPTPTSIHLRLLFTYA